MWPALDQFFARGAPLPLRGSAALRSPSLRLAPQGQGRRKDNLQKEFYTPKGIGLAGDLLFGGGVKITASLSPESGAAVQEAEELIESEQAVLAAGRNQKKGGYYIDKMHPGNLQEGDLIYSTTAPENLTGRDGLWATDSSAMVRTGGGAKAYQEGAQIDYGPKKIYVYRVKAKTPVAFGAAKANSDLGEGGYPQYYIRQQDLDTIEYSGTYFELK